MFSPKLTTLLLCVLAVISLETMAFSPAAKQARATTQLHFFGGLSKAFENEDMGERENAGLKNGPNINDQVTVNGKPVAGAVVGQKITVVAGRARVKIPTNCQKGDCGTCMVKVNGRKLKGTRVCVILFIEQSFAMVERLDDRPYVLHMYWYIRRLTLFFPLDASLFHEQPAKPLWDRARLLFRVCKQQTLTKIANQKLIFHKNLSLLWNT